jgi:hypothetical protein
MLDNLYENIGSKIKNWAKWIFVIEAIGAVITGLVLLFTDEDLILYGLLTLVCGPIVAFVGSWILYAFGELVEKTCDNEYNTRQILKKLNEKPIEQKQTSNNTTPLTVEATSDTPKTEKKEYADTDTAATFSTTENGKIICSQCKFEQPSGRKVCWHCGAKFKEI